MFVAWNYKAIQSESIYVQVQWNLLMYEELRKAKKRVGVEAYYARSAAEILIKSSYITAGQQPGKHFCRFGMMWLNKLHNIYDNENTNRMHVTFMKK